MDGGPVRVNGIAAGWAHSAAVAHGRVLVWGRPLDSPSTALMLARAHSYHRVFPRLVNALSLAMDVPIPLVPSLVDLPRVRKVYCGAGTTLALDEDGNAFAMGCDDHGQCGVGERPTAPTTAAVEAFTALDFDEPIIDVALGFRHSLAVDQKGRVFGWGKHDNGQVGAGEVRDVKDLRRYRPVQVFEDAIAVAAGLSHSAALTKQGEVVVWGKMRSRTFRSAPRRFGHISGDDRIGPAILYNDAFEPRFLEFPSGTPPRVAIAASNFHTVALDSAGDVWVVGLEKGTREMVVEPRRLIQGPYKAIRSGIDAVAVFHSQGGVVSPALQGGACVPDHLLDLPSSTKNLVDVAIGWKHTLALLDNT